MPHKVDGLKGSFFDWEGGEKIGVNHCVGGVVPMTL